MRSVERQAAIRECVVPVDGSSTAPSLIQVLQPMPDFISYHNPDTMGYRVPDEPGFSVLTNRRPSRVLGSRVWLISGSARPRKYHLHFWFVADTVNELQDNDYQYCIKGSTGQRFAPPLSLTDFPWFRKLQRSKGNFSFGFSPVKDASIIRHLERFVDSPAGLTSGPIQTTRRRATVTDRILRDTAASARVKALHRYRCQICGATIRLPDGSLYAEGHHIQPLGSPHDGPDIETNILCVCPNHHVELDYGCRRIDISALRRVRSHRVESLFVDYHNTRVMSQTGV